MKKLFFVVIAAVTSVALSSCAIEDNPEIRFDLQQLNVDAEGGDYTIKVTSTGIDNVNIYFYNLEYDEDGNLQPGEQWITLNEVIYDYDENATRDLPLFISGVDITVAPNTTGVTRKARIYAESYNKTDTIEIIQLAN
ncbi:MAG: BACON domain-containing protein [Alistipes sp.]|nr:BACON domain-containing protein [Alistipes sp.]